MTFYYTLSAARLLSLSLPLGPPILLHSQAKSVSLRRQSLIWLTNQKQQVATLLLSSQLELAGLCLYTCTKLVYVTNRPLPDDQKSTKVPTLEVPLT